VTIRYGDQSAQLAEIRRADPDRQGRWSFTSQQQTLRRLDRAFQGFYQRVQAGRRAGYPRFKTAARWDSVDFVDGDGARWRDPEDRWAAAYFQGVGQVKVKAHRPVVGRVKTLRLKRRDLRRPGRGQPAVCSCDRGRAGRSAAECRRLPARVGQSPPRQTEARQTAPYSR
jgi:putative transposase